MLTVITVISIPVLIIIFILIRKFSLTKEEIAQLKSTLKIYDEDLIWNSETGLKFKYDFFKILKSYIN